MTARIVDRRAVTDPPRCPKCDSEPEFVDIQDALCNSKPIIAICPDGHRWKVAGLAGPMGAAMTEEQR